MTLVTICTAVQLQIARKRPRKQFNYLERMVYFYFFTDQFYFALV